MGVFVGEKRVADETLATTLEALVGETARTVGLQQTLNILRFFHILPPQSGTNRPDALVARLPAATDAGIDALLLNHQAIEATLNYTFRDRGWLLQALTHPSYADNTHTDCNQRLAFVGEALCDWLLTAHIAERAEHLAADELRDLRRALTANIALGCYAVRARWHGHLLQAHQTLGERLAAFVTFQERNAWQLTDQVLLLIEETDEGMAEFVDVPSAIGGMFAAVLAAVWMDCGGRMELVWQTLWPLVREDVQRLVWQVPHGVRQRLEEFPGAKPRYDRPQWQVEDGVWMVGVRFTRRDEVVLMHGFGGTAEKACVAAAKVALHALMQ